MALGQVPPDQIEALALSPEAEELAAAYVDEGAVGERMGYPILEIRTPREVPGDE